MSERLRGARLRRAGGDPSAPGVYEKNFERGASGEEHVGLELNAQAYRRGGFGVLHNLVAEGSGGDIDHVVVGPSGVTVIDSKTWTGRVSLRGGKLRVQGWNRQRYLDSALRQAERVRAVLAAGGRDDIRVDALLCMVTGNAGLSRTGLDRVQGVGIGGLDAVVGHATRPGPLMLTDMHGAHAILSRAFAARGGGVEPSPSVRAASPRRSAASRKRVPSRRVSHRLRQTIAGLALVLLAVPIAVSLFNSASAELKLLSRAELMSHSAEYRALAERRAHGTVHGPRVVTSFEAFRLIYRHGRSCRVVITVPRKARVLGKSAPMVRATGCSARRHRP